MDTLTTLSNVNYSGYVLDSDVFFLRSNIVAGAAFNIENFTGTNTTYTNVLRFRLVKEQRTVTDAGPRRHLCRRWCRHE